MRLLTLLAYLCASVCLLSPLTAVLGGDSLTVTNPTGLFPQNTIEEKPSMFGIPNYGRTIVGQVVIPLPDAQACSPLTVPDANDPNIGPGPWIFLIDRGNCSFITKAKNAQAAGAVAIIVVNTEWSPLILMGDDKSVDADTIRTPGMMISHTDGAQLKTAINNNSLRTGVMVSMSYFLPNPDDVVEWTLFTSANDNDAVVFKEQMQEAVHAFGKTLSFEPSYYVINGTARCFNRTGRCDYCYDQCTNCGRYCQIDPQGGINSGASGASLVRENLRQYCVWYVGNSTGNVDFWWDYVNLNRIMCTGTNFLSSTCAETVMKSINMTTALIQQVNTCMGDTDKDSQNPNPLLDKFINFINIVGPAKTPEVVVNNAIYRGRVGCDDPITTECGIISMICAGYSSGTAPVACRTDPGCPLGQVRDSCGYCGGFNSSCASSNSTNNTIIIVPTGPSGDNGGNDGVSVGAFVGIIITIIILVGGAVYFYMRRQKAKMQDDIDTLLKQYLPMDGHDVGHAVPATGNKRDGMRLIGNLEDSSAPAEL